MAEKKVILPENTDELIEKWAPVIEGTGKWEKVVEGMPKVEVKDQALLATQLEILEQTQLSESTVSGNAGVATTDYVPILIPMVRRVMPALIGNKLFGTQPLSGPSGMIFSLRSLYQGDVGEIADTWIILTVSSLDDVGGNTLTVGGGISTATDDTGADPTEAAVGVVHYIEGLNVLINVTSGTFVATDLFCAASTMTQDEGQTISAYYVNAEQMAPFCFSNYSGSMTTATGETLGSDINELGFEISSSTVTAKTRKLKTRWTIELEDDLRAVHGMNAEQLLSGFCGEEIVREMNREFLNLVHTKAALATDNGWTTSTWTYSATAGAQGYTENERMQSLGNAIARQAITLSKANLRGPANYIIVTSGIVGFLGATGRFQGTGSNDYLKNPYAGKFDSMDVYVDMFPSTAGDYVLFGYKGDEVDAGLYYCPYIPLKVNKGYGEEDNIPRLFFSTRYGLGDNPFGANNYFHKMIVTTSALI